MYINYNDYELLYLMKEGIEPAKKIFFEKYKHLIMKFYREGYYSRRFYFSDFLQEGLLILDKTIKSYDETLEVNFYNYFKICFTRRLARINKKSDSTFWETRVLYKISDIEDKSFNLLSKLIEKEFQNEDELFKIILYECILNNYSLTSLCNKYNLEYNKVYYIYKKIRLKLENLLTN